MVRQARLNVEQLQRTADQDTRTAYVNFDASVAQVVVLREAATLAAKNFEAQVDDYRRGVVANLDVLTALQDYQTARIQLHDANMMARLDLINLHVAAGMAASFFAAVSISSASIRPIRATTAVCRLPRACTSARA